MATCAAQSPRRSAAGPETGGGRLGSLDGWRGVACLMVLFYHCGVNLREPPFALWGFVGVHVFFVLSGYLLFRPFAAAMAAGRRPPDVKNFYLRRLLRIYPPYIVSLIVFVLLRNATGVNRVTFAGFMKHASLLFNYDPSENFYGINAVFWSLAIEVQFYLLLPLACVSLTRLGGGVRAAAATVATFVGIGLLSRWLEHRFLAGVYSANIDHVRFRSVFAYLDLFGFGMAAAAWGAVHAESPPGRGRGNRSLRLALAVAGAFGFWLANQWCAWASPGTWQAAPSRVFCVFFPALLCASLGLLLLATVLTPPRGKTPAGATGLRRVGEVSYSLYLYHTGILYAFFKVSPFSRWGYNAMTLATALTCLAPCLFVSWLAFSLVERPSLKLVGKVRERNGEHPAATQSRRARADARDQASPIPTTNPTDVLRVSADQSL